MLQRAAPSKTTAHRRFESPDAAELRAQAAGRAGSVLPPPVGSVHDHARADE